MVKVLSSAVYLIEGLSEKSERFHVQDLKHYWPIHESTVSGTLFPSSRDEDEGSEVPAVEDGSPEEDRRNLRPPIVTNQVSPLSQTDQLPI